MTAYPAKENGKNSCKWRFFRAGGFDQVCIETGADMLALGHLDQKLWVSLSCPVKDLEFDPKTLSLIDSDGDGHIRAPEIINAVTWAASVLKNPETLINGVRGVPLSAIRDDIEDGRQLLASAREILKNLGKPEAKVISVEDTAEEALIFAGTKFNGDGVITPDASDDEGVRAVIGEIITCLGAEPDRSGAGGVSKEKVDAFFSELDLYDGWRSKAEKDPSILVLGEATEKAAASVKALKAKAEDYFTRCRLAAYDGRFEDSLFTAEADRQNLASKEISTETESVLALPLAAPSKDRPLPLKEGLNPAWTGTVEKFRADAVLQILGDKSSLSFAEWQELLSKFSAYFVWISEKPATFVEQLGIARTREILSGGYRETIGALITKDKALESEIGLVSSVDRLVRYCRDLHTLVNNFVSFSDFYTRKAKAVFQSGTLYLDGRSCELCIKVDDINKHAMLASLSRICLVYCECSRKGSPEKMTVAAAFTAGDSDHLMTGRNGVFYDRKGQDWNATVIRIIENPISVRQAFWLPYKQAGKMVGEQLMKLAASRSKGVQDKVAASLAQSMQKAETPKPAPAQGFDIGKFAGIFAAIGLAVGAIGTAIASVVTGLLRLDWWQVPLAAVGLLLLISGPSVGIAWFKLRQRNLGPLLDANGWAVNSRPRINIPFGTALTQVAKLPEGSVRPMIDPFAEKKTPWTLYAAAIIFIIAFLLLLRAL
ncbi:MAG: hypothetical protein EPN22_03540 [Nitrospirae bacterium]|nr:MAG: hypothetical protein EPN22_03540 [Nitrospirota bacterium]